jgi:2-keto-3-deoxy-L-rhamnonate aldolase RhmA
MTTATRTPAVDAAGRLRPDGDTARLGTFVKTNSVHVVEILAQSPLDFVVVDAEHAPFDRAAVDLLVLAGRAAGIPVMVRVPDMAPATILSVLDVGAAGLLVPHVDTAAQARELVALTRCRGGSRGFSSSTRQYAAQSPSIAECPARESRSIRASVLLWLRIRFCSRHLGLQADLGESWATVHAH